MKPVQEQRYKLVADIGGTHARFALVLPGQLHLEQQITLVLDEFDSIESAINTYLHQVEIESEQKPINACLAIASPITGDRVSMTNGHWQFSQSGLKSSLGLEQLLVINDFAAQAYATLHLQPDQLFKIGGGQSRQGYPVAVVGPGTGLGVGGLTFTNGEAQALSTEGGHVEFAPSNELEQEILCYLWRRYEHVSAERLISGMGLCNIHQALSAIRGIETKPITPTEITNQALVSHDALSTETLNLFCAMLGSVAGNIALTLGAQGGVYITGGIVPHILPFFEQSLFRERFEAKGRYRGYMEGVLTTVVLAEQPGLLGAAVALWEKVL